VKLLMRAGQWTEALRVASDSSKVSSTADGELEFPDLVVKVLLPGALEQCAATTISLEERSETLRGHVSRLDELRQSQLVAADAMVAAGDPENGVGEMADTGTDLDSASQFTESALSFATSASSASSASSLHSFARQRSNQQSSDAHSVAESGYSGYSTLQNLPEQRREAKRARKIRARQLRNRAKARQKFGGVDEDEYLIKAIRILIPTEDQLRAWRELEAVLVVFGQRAKASRLRQSARQLEATSHAALPLLVRIPVLLASVATPLVEHYDAWVRHVQEGSEQPSLPEPADLAAERARDPLVRAAVEAAWHGGDEAELEFGLE
jgi:hypothetical protein